MISHGRARWNLLRTQSTTMATRGGHVHVKQLHCAQTDGIKLRNRFELIYYLPNQSPILVSYCLCTCTKYITLASDREKIKQWLKLKIVHSTLYFYVWTGHVVSCHIEYNINTSNTTLLYSNTLADEGRVKKFRTPRGILSSPKNQPRYKML